MNDRGDAKTNAAPTLAGLAQDIEPLRACLVVESSSGALHDQFRSGPLSVEPEAVARTVAGLARAQTDLVGLVQPATLCTLEWPDVLVMVRSVSANALAVFFFDAQTPLGLARVHVAGVVDGLDALLPRAANRTVRSFPALPTTDLPPPPPVAIDRQQVEQPGIEPSLDAEPDPQPPTLPAEVGRGQRLLDYLDEHAPDTHAALLRVSLQTGLPLSLLKNPAQLSDDEFGQVTASVRRILGVEQIPV